MPPTALRKIKDDRKTSQRSILSEDLDNDIMRPPSYSSSSEEEQNLADIKPAVFDRNSGKRGRKQQQRKLKKLAPTASPKTSSGYGGVNSYRSRRGIGNSPRSTGAKILRNNEEELPNFTRKTREESYDRRFSGKKGHRAVYGRNSQPSSQSTTYSYPNSSQTSQTSPKKKLKCVDLPSSDSEESEDQIPRSFKPPSQEFLDFTCLSDSDSKLFSKATGTSAYSSGTSSPVAKRKASSVLTTAILKDDHLFPKSKLPKVFHDAPPSSFSEPSSSFETFSQKLINKSPDDDTKVVFKAYNDFDFDDELLTFSNVTESTPSKDHVDIHTDHFLSMTPTARCPMCNEPVSPNMLRNHGSMNTRRQEQFCLAHRRKSAKVKWETNRYPHIDWEVLDARISNHHKFLRRLINGEESYYRSLLQDKIDQGKDRNLRTTTTNLIPGYYGLRGLRIISENVFRKFTPLLKKRIVQDRLIAARGYTPYVQSVLVPEVAALLIQEDMLITISEARDIMDESAAVGELLHEEVREEFTTPRDY